MADISFQELNELDAEAFIVTVSDLLQGQRWLAEAVVDDRPFGSVRQMHKAIFAEVLEAGNRKRCDLIEAYDSALPTEGEAPALGEVDTEEYVPARSWRGWRERYFSSFGFAFVLAEIPKEEADLLGLLIERIDNDEPTERVNALREISQITFGRLEQAFRIDEQSEPKS